MCSFLFYQNRNTLENWGGKSSKLRKIVNWHVTFYDVRRKYIFFRFLPFSINIRLSKSYKSCATADVTLEVYWKVSSPISSFLLFFFVAYVAWCSHWCEISHIYQIHFAFFYSTNVFIFQFIFSIKTVWYFIQFNRISYFQVF